eukprot:2184673-Pleurochrysis_carterae.AAC.6
MPNCTCVSKRKTQFQDYWHAGSMNRRWIHRINCWLEGCVAHPRPTSSRSQTQCDGVPSSNAFDRREFELERRRRPKTLGHGNLARFKAGAAYAAANDPECYERGSWSPSLLATDQVPERRDHAAKSREEKFCFENVASASHRLF